MEGLVEFLKEKYPPVIEGKLAGIFYQKRWWNKNAVLDYYNYIKDFQRKNQLGSFPEAVYLILHGIDSVPLCECGRRKRFLNLQNGYAETCGNRHCFYFQQVQHEKAKKTWMEKYGVDNPRKAEEIQKKIYLTCLRKYGVDVPAKSGKIKEKIKQTCIERYGVDNPMKVEGFKQKLKESLIKKYEGLGFGSTILRQKIQRTCIRKYGVDNLRELDEINNRIKQTCLEKYGVDNPFKSKEIRGKAKRTSLEKYGFENPSQSPLVKEKRKQTCLKKYERENYCETQEFKEKTTTIWREKYGVDNPFKAEEIKEKIKEIQLKKYGGMGLGSPILKQKIQQTCLERYGSPTVGNVPEIIKKRINTCLKKYGAKSPACSGVVKTKLRELCRKKYGVEWPAQKHIKHFENYNLDFVLKHFVDKNGFFEIKKASEYFNVSYNVWYQNPEFAGKLPPAKKEFGEFENEIVEYLKSLDSSLYIERNVKGVLNNPNFELDIFLPDNKIAIEFDGLVWHSFGMSEVPAFNNYMFESELKYRHLEKTEQCEKQGIRLFHIFENEWILKQDIWKSILANALGKNIRRIYARICEVKEISNEEAQDFLTENHLQGYIPAKIHLGLFLDNELVSLMSFGKSRFNKNYEWELYRFCNKLSTSVIGGFSKLFKYFVETYAPKNVVSYVDRRYGKGGVYEKAGFELIGKTKPDYYYFEKGSLELYHRSNFQKHLLKEKLEYFDETKTETENMYLNGYRKIYDCGNLIYLWRH